MFANPHLIYYDAFVFCSIPRLFVCLCMGIFTSKQYANVYVKSIFVGPRSIAGVPSSQALPGFLITAPPPVFVPAVLGALAVWIQTKKKREKRGLIGAFPTLVGGHHSSLGATFLASY